MTGKMIKKNVKRRGGNGSYEHQKLWKRLETTIAAVMQNKVPQQ